NQKGRPPFPSRSWRKRAGPGEESRISRAMTIIKGRDSTRPIDAPITSRMRFAAGCEMLEPGRASPFQGAAGVSASRGIVSTSSNGDGVGKEDLTVGSLRFEPTRAGVEYEPRDTSGRLGPDAARI